MGKSRAPSPPDPAATAAAQAGANREAILESARVSQIGTQTPFGRTFFTGQVGAPDRTFVQELTPEGQRTVEAQQALASQLAGFGAEQLGPQVMERLGAGPGSVEEALYQRGQQRIGQQFDPAEETLRSRLLGQGIPEGSRAFDQAMGQLLRDRREQELALGFESQIRGGAEDRAQRSQAINELSALLQGAPAIGAPAGFQGPAFQIAAPDITGLTAQQYAGQVSAANQRAQELGGLYGTLGSLGAAGILASDARAKTDLEFVGMHKNLPWYTFRYIWDESERTIGVLAQHVQQVKPDAVYKRADGLLMVDYGAL